MFLENEWYRFVDFLNGKYKSDLYEISKEIRYLVVAGDLVDGSVVIVCEGKKENIKELIILLTMHF